MVQRVEELRGVSRRSERGILPERTVSPPVVGPGRIEPPTHPATPRVRTGRLRPAPAARRADWTERTFEAAWVGLVLACAAEWAWHLL